MDKEDVVHIYKGILVIVVYWLSRVQLFVSARLLCPWDFPGNSTRVGSHFLLQGIFLIQGSNPNLLHCRQIPYYSEAWEALSLSKFEQFIIYFSVLELSLW